MYEYKIIYSYTDYDGCDRQTHTLSITLPFEIKSDKVLMDIVCELCKSSILSTRFYSPATLTILKISVICTIQQDLYDIRNE